MEKKTNKRFNDDKKKYKQFFSRVYQCPSLEFYQLVVVRIDKKKLEKKLQKKVFTMKEEEREKGEKSEKNLSATVFSASLLTLFLFLDYENE